MNYKMLLNVIGKILLVEAVLMCLPLIIGLIYREDTYLGFVIPVVCLAAIGVPAFIFPPKDKTIYAREGFVIVAFAWLLMSLAGALPFVITKAIPSYVDAFFETVSGFTTTGASVVADVEIMPKSLLFWRSFTHGVGGMGVLVLVLAILPDYYAGVMHIFRAESPGPTVGKLVSKIKFTARILYGIYIVMTVAEIIFLVCGKMPFFDAVVISFGTAGTGGFSITNNSIAYYDSTYLEMVIAVFMFLFGINFNFFYLIITGNVLGAFKIEEVRVYFIIVVLATLAIAVNVTSLYGSFGQAVRYAFFQVSSVSTTTGYATTDFNLWPSFSKALLLALMMIGACAGSTGGGLKVARLIILSKSAFAGVKKIARPRTVSSLRFEGEPVNESVLGTVKTFFALFIGWIIISTLLISIEGYGDIETNLSATIACFNNIGPGLGIVGPMGNYGGYSDFSKILLSINMLAGRLEIFPVMILFSPSTWKRH